MSIDINLDFSAGIHRRPSVTNSTTQNTPIPSTQPSLEWQLKPNQDGVQITGVKFYSSQSAKGSKTSPVTPAYLNLPGGHINNDPTTWKIDFKAGQGPNRQASLWYDVEFADDDFNNLDWDPQLTISPR